MNCGLADETCRKQVGDMGVNLLSAGFSYQTPNEFGGP
jgi:hypothetical protein